MASMHQIYHNIEIATPAAQIFDAVTLPVHLNNWWTKKCTGIPEIGQEYNFWFGPEFDWKARVADLKGKKFISYVFTDADVDWTGTHLSFKTEEISEKETLLYLYHGMWKEANIHFGRTSYCWAQYIGELKNYLENN